MPISSNPASIEKKRSILLQNQTKSIEQNAAHDKSDEAFLTIESALPSGGGGDRRRLYKRSHSTLNATSLIKASSSTVSCDPVTVETGSDGSLHITRSENDKEAYPDRISLDRRGLTSFPIIDGESTLRLLSLQHNLISNLGGLKTQNFPYLVFLDIYDNQLDQLSFLDKLENLRVLLIGKNRIRKIEGLNLLKKIEVLDLHGNQITHVGSGLSTLSELKVLNLAGNQIRYIGTADFQGLSSLQELNLRRNRLKKLLGFGETLSLTKLFVSNNDLQSVEDISSLAKSSNLKEISIDSNPVFLSGDCVSFLVSYLPHLVKLNTAQLTDQVRKAAMAWRRNKESTNSSFMDLTSDVCLNVRREEIISNARTNWELLRSQTKCLAVGAGGLGKAGPASKAGLKSLNVDCDLILTSLAKPTAAGAAGVDASLGDGASRANNNASKQNPTKLKTRNSITTSNNNQAGAGASTTRVPPHHQHQHFLLNNKKKKLLRTSSQDTDNSQNTTSNSSNTSSNEYIRLPPILVPIIKKMEQQSSCSYSSKESGSVKLSGSMSSIGPNVDSSVSSLGSDDDDSESSTSPSSRGSGDEEESDSEPDDVTQKVESRPSIEGRASSNSETAVTAHKNPSPSTINIPCAPNRRRSLSAHTLTTTSISTPNNNNIEPLPPSTTILRDNSSSTCSNITTDSNLDYDNYQPIAAQKHEKLLRNVKSAVITHHMGSRWQTRAATAKTTAVKKQQLSMMSSSPSGVQVAPPPSTVAAVVSTSSGKDREQGGDYLIEICGRYLNVYGQCALRFVDRSWNSAKASDVTTVKFHYVNFNSVAQILNRLKHRFPNVDHFIFKETNIHCLGQLNALAEVQGLSSLYIDPEGNAIVKKTGWQDYAVYRLSHWGLTKINDTEITEEDIKRSNQEYQSLSDLVLWSLPEVLLQPLLVRLRLDVSHGVSEQNAKTWLLTADPELRNVVSKEALQWKKGNGIQDDPILKQKVKSYMCQLLEEMSNSVNKLRILDRRWSTILQEFVTNALLDYSQLDMYMKQKLLELMK